MSDRLGHLSSNKSAVNVFIILSGSVISLLLSKRTETYGAFITRRFFRIFPTFIALFLISCWTLDLQRSGLAGSTIFAWSARNAARLGLFDSALGNMPGQISSHFVMLHGVVPKQLVPDVDVGVLGQAWSISLEWQFYLVAPLLVGIVIGQGITRLVGAAALAVLIAFHWFWPLRDNIAFLPHSLGWFAVGIASFFCWKQKDHFDTIIRFKTPIICLILALGIVARSPGMVVWALVLFIIFGAFPRTSTACSQFLRSPAMQYLRRVSYSTYLFHMLPIYLGMYLLNGLGLPSHLYAALLTIGTVVSTFLFSALLHKYVEVPGIALGKRLTGPFHSAVQPPTPSNIRPSPAPAPSPAPSPAPAPAPG